MLATDRMEAAALSYKVFEYTRRMGDAKAALRDVRCRMLDRQDHSVIANQVTGQLTTGERLVPDRAEPADAADLLNH